MLPNLEVPLRHADFSLEEHHVMLQEAFRSFFKDRCPIERVREAESGFDPTLWAELQDLRPIAMAVPERSGGDGAGLAELVVVAEEFGRRVAPVPLVEAAVTARLLARFADRLPADLLRTVLDGSTIATLALHPGLPGVMQLIPSAAVADVVVGLVDDQLVMVTNHTKPATVTNQANAPLGRFNLSQHDGSTTVLALGDDARSAFDSAQREWKLVMAAAQIGIAQTSIDIAVAYARERRAFGTLIGAFQAIAHPLVDAAMATETSRRLCYKAAWWADHGHHDQRKHIPFAYLSAHDAAVLATKVGIHTLGGVGFTVESDLELFFRCSKGWTLVAGDPNRVLDEIAAELYGPAA